MGQLNKRRIWLGLTVFVGVAVGVVVAAATYFTLGPYAENYAHRTKFDVSGWQNQSGDRDREWPMRLRMVDDLVDSRRLNGLGRDEVSALLGPADATNKWRDWDVVYWLGPERGHVRIDSEWLVIRFDPAGRVAEYRVVRD